MSRIPSRLEAVVVTVVLTVLAVPPLGYLMFREADALELAGRLGLSLAVLIALLQCGVAAGLCVAAQRLRGLRFPGLARADWSGALRGTAVGLGTVTAGLAVAVGFGGGSIEAAPDLTPMILLSAAMLFFRALAEELLARMMWGALPSLVFPRWSVVAGTSLLFGLAHLGNPGMGFLPLLNVTLAGVVMALLFFPRQRGAPAALGAATGFHFAWNFSLVVLGVNVSGWDVPGGSLFEFTARDPLWSGGRFGLEGSPAATVVLLAAAVVVEGRSRRRYPGLESAS